MESAEFSVDRQAILITALDYSNFSNQLPFFITTDVENQIVTTEIQVSLNPLTTDEAKRLINVLYSKISSFPSVSPCIQQSFEAAHLRKFRDFVLHHSSHYNVPTTKSEYQAYFLKNGSGNRCSLYMLSVSVNEERGAIEASSSP
ncbi:unnamed protein product, partial [Mesorhabditis belari]|uniref:Uncharacterized protein n=1 Tax=Mesorhabditis belari TaxID=2138241 RepID=A0AAF3FAF7_9BILA